MEGPVHVSWGIGERRRLDVWRPARRVRVCTLERRIAPFPGGFGEGFACGREGNINMRRVRKKGRERAEKRMACTMLATDVKSGRMESC